MYFNNNKNNTNIDSEFSSKNNIINFIIKFKIFIIIIPILIIIVLILSFSNKKEIHREINTYLTLTGDEIISIYQGTDYIEPGYSAYNDNKLDLTNEVNITSNLDTNTIGEYEIIYTINNITKKRTINVIKKSEEYTFIYLNTVNNSVDIYLNINETYNEPGYTVFNSAGKNLTNSVKISGNVNTSKKGIYKLTYSLIDSNNVTISTSRNVIVMDSNINLLLDNNNYTNKDVKINIKITDDYFDYMILPNNQKINNKDYTYTVNENGKYTFITYNKQGNKKESSIEIKNIDKTLPTGSCNGYYKDNKTIININAEDNIGINKYVINNTSYTSNKITINKEISTANITIYDKAGNIKNISCNLENKNSTEQQKENSLESIYTSSNSHQNSINGIKYIMYDQADPRWGKTKYSNGKTIAEIGCLITSMAVISSASDHNVTPLYIFDNKINNYYMTNAIPMLTGKDNFNCVVGSISYDSIVKDLSSGKVGIIKVEADSIFTANQHYMSLIDISSDGKKIFIGNSYGGGKGSYNRTGWFDTKTVLTDVHEYVVCTPTQKLIDKFK